MAVTDPSSKVRVQDWQAWSIRGFALIADHENAMDEALHPAGGDWKRVEATGHALREFIRSTAIAQKKHDRA